ncbi:MAG: hypothetical protein H6725_03900 [Sandaracinaceae bacterium]|nr:hypothetical protein [Sandaracinaceae bacterium]
MTTMTERDLQKRLVDLSVITLSALVLGGGYLLAASVDRERARLAPAAQEETVQLAMISADVADVAPVPGLQPAPRPTRRVVVVRRTRAS